VVVAVVVWVVAGRLQLHPCAEVHPHHSQLAAAEQGEEEEEEGEARAVADRRVANQVVVVGQHPRETEETEIETNTIVMGSRSRLVAAAVMGQQEEEEEAQHLPGAGVGS
jgi:hypothetical protein